MPTLNITSALLMGLFLIAIAATFLRLRHWRRVKRIQKGASGLDLVEAAIYHPTTWTVLFVLVALGLTAVAVAFVGGAPVPGMALPGAGMVQAAFVGAMGVVFGGFLFIALYTTARNRGLQSAPAVAFSAVIVGLIFVTVVTVKLLMAG